MIKVMLIEDEEQIRFLLKKMIEKLEGFEVVAEADSFASALEEYSKYKPDVVFVDVDLNGDSGLECAKIMVNLNPKLKVIFATAHSEYMANAFEIYAFDYLVKPFNMERVHKTLKRIEEATNGTGITSQKTESVKDQSLEADRGRILIKGKEQMFFVDTKDIIFLERSDSATYILTKEETFKSSVSLTDFEEKLPGDFMRSHKSYIINSTMISKVEPYGRWTYIVKFKGFEQTALITSQKYDELKAKYK